MPNYDFLCPKCQHVFEKNVRLADLKRPPACPACKHRKTERQLSAPAVQPHVTPRFYARHP